VKKRGRREKVLALHAEEEALCDRFEKHLVKLAGT